MKEKCAAVLELIKQAHCAADYDSEAVDWGDDWDEDVAEWCLLLPILLCMHTLRPLFLRAHVNCNFRVLHISPSIHIRKRLQLMSFVHSSYRGPCHCGTSTA
jgi:hypothetical protein